MTAEEATPPTVSAPAVEGAVRSRPRFGPAAFGARATGARAERMSRSPQFRDGQFHNRAQTRPLRPDPATSRGMVRELLRRDPRRKPAGPVPLADAGTAAGAAAGAARGARLTWYGHASALVEIEGRRVLLDPLWSERCSPSSVVGPRRLHPVPAPLDSLPPLSAVVISHDHYDHLDLATVRALTAGQSAPFVVPLGVGAHLDRWRVPANRIIELDWDESVDLDGLRLTATAAQHFSGRTLARDRTLWSSWVVAGPTRRVFYTGDSGYFDGYAGIGAAYGPFDAALVQIGAYDERWPDIHMTPEEAVAAHLDVRGGLLVPVHWGTFVLAFHPWSEPVDRLLREAEARGVPVAVPRPGQPVDVDDPPAVDGWWRAVSADVTA